MNNIKRIRYSLICILLSLVLLTSLCSCALKVSAEELSASYTRQATDSGEITDEFKTAMAELSFKLFKNIAADKSEESKLFSPLSAALCLGMLTNGADGETLSQLEDLFGMDIDTLNKCLYAYTSSLYSAGNCKVKLANSIWCRDDFAVKDGFLQTNADWYGSDVYSAPFDAQTLKDINNWCNYHSDGMIKEILKEFDPDTVMVLINSLLFDAEWEEKYTNHDISSSDFCCYDGTKKEAQFLHSDEKTCITIGSAKGFAKDYKGGKYSLVCLLPDEGTDVYDFIASLDGDGWLAAWNGRLKSNVTVSIPEFEYDAHIKLNDVLGSMGVNDMFDGEKANFAKISDRAIYCSSVEQKTYIKVDRNGTKAAAITWASNKELGGPRPMIFDRPFVYAIVDNASGLPLFIGAVTTV